MKKLLLILCISILPAQGFQDCVISNDGKLSDIRIEQNDIIDVYPIFTILNEKNMLYLHPLKEGETKFCVLKNGKDIVTFNVNVTQNNTIIDFVEGFEIFSVDTPPVELTPNPLTEEPEYSFELDLPPGGGQWTN